jgi:flagellar basal body rod protein FlgG
MGNLYTGAMGMISFQNEIEVIGNNIANSRTNGFKKDVETFKVFEESFFKISSNDRNEILGKYQHQVHMDEVHTMFEQGNIFSTGSMTDFSIQDTDTKATSFFTVEKNGEKLLTRDGAFQIDNKGNLSMNDGSFVLDKNGNRIIIPENAKITADRFGNIVNDETGQVIASLGIKTVKEEDKSFLEKIGNNKFGVISMESFEKNYGPLENILEAYDKNASLQRLFKNRETLENIVETRQINVLENATRIKVSNGTLEQSNVDVAKEMTELMLAQRGFQASAKVVQAMDKVNEKDANQIGL